jgi:hypothetical protein
MRCSVAWEIQSQSFWKPTFWHTSSFRLRTRRNGGLSIRLFLQREWGDYSHWEGHIALFLLELGGSRHKFEHSVVPPRYAFCLPWLCVSLQIFRKDGRTNSPDDSLKSGALRPAICSWPHYSFRFFPPPIHRYEFFCALRMMISPFLPFLPFEYSLFDFWALSPLSDFIFQGKWRRWNFKELLWEMSSYRLWPLSSPDPSLDAHQDTSRAQRL